ncbi:MAG: hypothetical protein ACOYMO_00915 [Phycisphaerales bacterium]
MAQEEAANCCCQTASSAGCSDGSCQQTVCAIDPYCCSTRWDSTCVSEAYTYCGNPTGSNGSFCADLNQNGTPDGCESGGPNPADCDGDGIPDLNRSGWNGKCDWIGPTSGTATFDADNLWSNGRPGTQSISEVNLPYTQYYNSLLLKANCNNAVRSFGINDGGTSNLHALTIDLSTHTLRFAGPAISDLTILPNLYNTLGVEFRNGTMSSTDSAFTLRSTGASQITFGDITLEASAFQWNSDLSGYADDISLIDSVFRVGSFGFGTNTATGASIPSHLMLEGSRIEMSGEVTNASQPFTIGAGHWLSVDSSNPYDYSEITGYSLQVNALENSLISLNGQLLVGGTLRLGGGLSGMSTPLAQSSSQASKLFTMELVYPDTRNAYIHWNADLSGESGTTPFGQPSIMASSQASIGGPLTVFNMSNSSSTLQEGLSIPLLSANSFASGHANFDLVRCFNPDNMPVPGGYYVTTENVNGVISIVVKRGAVVEATPNLQSPLSTTPLRTVVLKDGSNGGGSIIATLTNNASTQGSNPSSTIRIYALLSSPSTITQIASVNGPADATDMVAGDIDGDGQNDLLVSYGLPGKAIAWKLVNNTPTILWTHQLPAGTRAECVCILGGASRKNSLLPVGSGTGVGTSSAGKGGVTTTDSTGAFTGSEELNSRPSTLNGTDIDNDDAVTAGGESSETSLLPSNTQGFVQVVKRNATGGLTVHAPVYTIGVPTALAVADLDGDGHTDVAASCSGISGSFPIGSRPTAVVLRGTGSSPNDPQSPLLGIPSPIDVGDTSAQGTGVVLTDADHDGIPDLAVSWMSDYGQGLIGGGAAVFPVRDQRASGGLTVGAQLTFAQDFVPVMASLGDSSLLTIREPLNLVGSAAMHTTDFAAQVVQGDLDGDGYVTNADISLLLLDFGPCPDPTQAPCPADVDGSGEVDNGDISFMLLLFE